MTTLPPHSLSFEVLKEPRGLLRVLQWIFALLAFATCSHYSTSLTLTIQCQDLKATQPPPVTQYISYPFRLDQYPPVKFNNWCNKTDVPDPDGTSAYDIHFPGNFSSDAEFFVFTGVISWLFCFLSLAVYLYYNSLYEDEQKNYPKIDFLVSAVLAMFWLAGSAAWANGLNGLKSVCSGIGQHMQICLDDVVGVSNCPSSCSQFSEANISVLLGFLNCFLWSANLWFLYKDTKWFTGGNQAQGAASVESGQQEQEPSPFQPPSVGSY